MTENKTAFRLARERAGLTRKQCAALLDISNGAIQKYEQTGLAEKNRRVPGALLLEVLDWYARKVPPYIPGEPWDNKRRKRKCPSCGYED